MDINLYAKAVELLEKVANSVHERDSKNPSLNCFSTTEVHLVENWLQDFVTDIAKSPVK